MIYTMTGGGASRYRLQVFLALYLSCAQIVSALHQVDIKLPQVADDKVTHHDDKTTKFPQVADDKVTHKDEKSTKCVCSWNFSNADSLCSEKKAKPRSGEEPGAAYEPSLMQGDQAHKKMQDELLVSQQVQINQLTQLLEKKSVLLTIVEQKTAHHLKQIDLLERELRHQDAAMQIVKEQIHGFQQKTTRDCADVQKLWSTKSGTYNISLPHAMLPVWCDLKTAGGGWTLIQRRFDGTVNFMRDWDEYKKGFGYLNGEFWMGNDHIYYLTNQARGLYRLRIDMWDFNNNHAYAEYDQFYIGGEDENYKLHTGTYNGTAGDSLTFHNGHAFSTIFHDVYNRKCPVRYEGGWWYSDSNTCHIANLNGRYHQHRFRGKNSMSWFYWHRKHLAMKKVEMKVRPSYF